MNNPGTDIERWLIEGAVEYDQAQDSELWEVNFEAGRQLVIRDFGPYHKVYLRPGNFERN